MADEIKNILKTGKLKIGVAHPQIKGKRCLVYTDTWNGAPRIVLATNDPAEMPNKQFGFGRIEAPMDLLTYMTVLGSIEAVAQETLNALSTGKTDLPESKYAMQCLTAPAGSGGFQPGQRPEPPTLKATVHWGRDPQGIVYISVISADSARVKVKVPFAFTDGRFHKFIGPDGQPVPKSMESAQVAKAWVAAGRALIPGICNSSYEVKPFGGQAGGQRQGNFQQRAPAQAASGDDNFGDDIPF